MEQLVYKRRPFRLAPDSMQLRDQQRARPESWRDLWPDDPLIIAVRDRLSRLLRLYYNWPSEAFIPEDQMKAVTGTGGPEEFFFHEPDFDLWELFNQPHIEDGLYPQVADGATLLECVRAMAGRITDPAALASTVAAKAFEPLIHGSETFFSAGVCYYGHHCQQRLRHALRDASWRDRWPDSPALFKIREAVGPVLARQFGWLDAAFVPDDLMAAITYNQGYAGYWFGWTAAARAVAEAAGLRPDRVDLQKAKNLTYLDFLRSLISSEPDGSLP